MGRRSLLRWKTLAIHLEEERQRLTGTCHITSSQYPEDDEEERATVSEAMETSAVEEDKEGEHLGKSRQGDATEEEDCDSCKFNEDLLCDHGEFP